METLAEGLIQQALQMPPQSRALIAERLLSSLDAEPDFDIEAAWQREVQRRLKEVESGEVVCIPWEQARILERAKILTLPHQQ